MALPSRVLGYSVQAGAVCALAIAVALAARGAGPGKDAPTRPAMGPGGIMEPGFDSPESIAQRFTDELGRMASAGRTPPPSELVRQLTEQSTLALQTSPDPGLPLRPEAIYARARRSVVIVGAVTACQGRRHWHGRFATGFVIHRAGVIMTNAHVVEAFGGAKALGVMTDDGRVFPVKAVLAADRHKDVAALKVEATDLTPLPIATGVPVGAAVYCLSHPALDCEGTQNGFFTFTQGMVCGKFRVRFGAESDAPLDVLAITADYAKGSSGGPILNEHGAVVGMVCQTRSLCSDPWSNDVQMTWKFARPSSSILALFVAGNASQ